MDQMDKMAHRFVILIPNLNGNNKAIKKLILKVLDRLWDTDESCRR